MLSPCLDDLFTALSLPIFVKDFNSMSPIKTKKNTQNRTIVSDVFKKIKQNMFHCLGVLLLLFDLQRNLYKEGEHLTAFINIKTHNQIIKKW